MLLLLLVTLGAVSTYVDVTTLYVSGTGYLDESIYKASGAYLSYTAIVFNDGPSEIRSNAISFCSNLKSIHLSKTIEIIKAPFLRYCPNVKTITLDNENTNFVLDSFGALYSSNFIELIRVPSYLLSYTIKSNTEELMEQSFQQCLITSIVVPSSVETINTLTFCDSKVQNIKIESVKITTLSSQAFGWMTSLVSINIPSTITQLGTLLFNSDKALKNVTFAEDTKISEIPNSCFANTGIEVLRLPEGIQVINNFAMRDCSSLRIIELPSTLTSISTTWLSYTYGVEVVTINPGGKYEMSSGMLIDINRTEICFIGKNVTSLTIPGTVKSFAAGALQFATNLEELTVNNSEVEDPLIRSDDGVIYDAESNVVAIVGGKSSAVIISGCKKFLSYSAMRCQKLKSIEFPDSLEEIQEGSFWHCSGLTQLVLPINLTKVATSSFEECSSLTIVTAKSSTKQIEFYDSSFQNCFLLHTFECDDRVGILSSYTFRYCNKLSKFTISEKSSITTIYTSAFESCSSLAEFSISSKITTLHTYAFAGCSKLTTFSIPSTSTLRHIDISCFQNCHALKSIRLSSTIDVIKSYAFKNCYELEEFEIDANAAIESLSGGIFEGCSKLTSFVIPSNVNFLEPSIFIGCSEFTTVSSHSQHYTCQRDLVYNQNDILILCPVGRTVANVTKGVKQIGPNAFYKCKKLEQIEFEEESLLERISGSTFMECSSLKSLLIPKSVKYMESNAFASCISLTSVVFKDGSLLESIGDSTFSGCSKLSEVIFTESSQLKSIGASAFYGCTELESFYIPSSTSSVLSSIFEGCTNLKSVEFGPSSGIKKISSNLFRDCSSLKNVTLPPLVTEIGDNAFRGCAELSLTEQLPSSITKIGDSAFYGCTNLVLSALPPGIQTIGISAFQRCSTAAVLELPKSIKSVGSSSFFSTPVKTVIYCGDLVLDSETAFAIGAVGYVKVGYTGSSLLGIEAIRCMTSECVLIPPTPSASYYFTSRGKNILNAAVITELMLDRIDDK